MKNDFMNILKSFLFSQIDEEILKSEVEQLQEEYPEVSSYELCDVLITKTSVSAAISGGITGGIPWPLNLLFAVPDFLLLLLFQTKMIMKIAILAGKEPIEDSRFNEVIACMGVSAGAVAGTIGIRKIIENGVSPFLLKMILKQFTKSSSSHLVPFFGAIAGTAINVSSVIGAGFVAREFYFPKDAEITGYKSDSEEEEDNSEENDEVSEENEEESAEDNSEEVEEEKEFENEDKAEEKEKEKVEEEKTSEDKDKVESEEEKVEKKEEESKEDSEEKQEETKKEPKKVHKKVSKKDTQKETSEKKSDKTYLEEAEEIKFENDKKEDK